MTTARHRDCAEPPVRRQACTVTCARGASICAGSGSHADGEGWRARSRSLARVRPLAGVCQHRPWRQQRDADLAVVGNRIAGVQYPVHDQPLAIGAVALHGDSVMARRWSRWVTMPIVLSDRLRAIWTAGKLAARLPYALGGITASTQQHTPPPLHHPGPRYRPRCLSPRPAHPCAPAVSRRR